MREHLSQLLSTWGHEVAATFGPADSAESVDYPDIALELCRALIENNEGNRPALGLLVCGTGQGMAISANKVAGIRAGAVGDVFSAKMIREHNDANVICLGQRVLGSELAVLILRSFIDSKFTGGRHQRRVGKIGSLDRQGRDPIQVDGD